MANIPPFIQVSFLEAMFLNLSVMVPLSSDFETIFCSSVVESAMQSSDCLF